MKNRLSFSRILLGLVFAIVIVLAYLRLTAAPIHPFDSTWYAHRGTKLMPDAKTRDMARRAQIDHFIAPIPEVGRKHLLFDCVRSAGAGALDVVLFPGSMSDTLVIYHFSADGKMLWKQVEWTEA